jgi:hypothetical protein
LASLFFRWVLFGDLKDPYQEFFVSKRVGSTSVDETKFNIWLDAYHLRQSMLPAFLSLHLATKILVIGKSINFIRLCRAKRPASSSAPSVTKDKSLGASPRSGPSRLAQLKQDAAFSSVSSDAGSVAGSNAGVIVTLPRKDLSSPSKKGPIPLAMTHGSLAPTQGTPPKPQQHLLRRGMSKPSMAEALGGSPRGNLAHTESMYSMMDWFKSDDNEVSGSLPVDEKIHDGEQIVEDETDVYFSVSDELESKLHDLKFGDEEHLASIIGSISEVVDRRLLRMMFKEFYIYDHLLACKQFLLLGQGDFVTCLMDSIAPELQKQASKLYRHNLTGILEGALRASNAQFVPAPILNRVLVRLLEPAKGDTGWEIFALDYAVDLPINAIIHSEAMPKYQIAFSMLWRLKRVEWALSAAWKQLMTLSHTAWRGHGRDGRSAWRREFPNLLPILHKCTMGRGRMMYVINNLCAFIMFEVLESAWKTLLEGLHGAKNLDDVIRVHDAYLNEILDRALLTQQHEHLNTQVNCSVIIRAGVLDADFNVCIDPEVVTVSSSVLRS